jgi:hypothetical protein
MYIPVTFLTSLLHRHLKQTALTSPYAKVCLKQTFCSHQVILLTCRLGGFQSTVRSAHWNDCNHAAGCQGKRMLDAMSKHEGDDPGEKACSFLPSDCVTIFCTVLVKRKPDDESEAQIFLSSRELRITCRGVLNLHSTSMEISFC